MLLLENPFQLSVRAAYVNPIVQSWSGSGSMLWIHITDNPQPDQLESTSTLVTPGLQISVVRMFLHFSIKMPKILTETLKHAFCKTKHCLDILPKEN